MKKLLLLSLLLATAVHEVCASAVKIEQPSPLEQYTQYIDYRKLFDDMFAAYDAKISDEERLTITKTGGSPVYGEILFESIQFLKNEIKFTQKDVFYDLGSGLGRFVLDVFLSTPARKSVGVEFSPNRFLRSKKATKGAKKLYEAGWKYENSVRKQLNKPLLEKVYNKEFELLQMDMMDTDLSDATVIFTCSTCFEDEFMERLTVKFAGLADGVRLVTLRKLPYNESVHLIKTYILPMTWSPETPVYSYVIDHTKTAERGEEEEKSH